MTLSVSLTSTPVNVSLAGGQIAVNLTPTQVAVALAGVGPQGATGPAGPAGASLRWSEVTSSSQQMASGNGYVLNNSSRVTAILPPSADFGDTVRVVGKGAGGWLLAQNAGQTIHFGSQNTTTGTAGGLASQSVFDAVELLCTTMNSDWTVLSSQGNLTVT